MTYFPIKHFFVEIVDIVHLLQIKLKLVFVHDCDIGADEGLLFIVEMLPEGGEVLVTIPICVVCVLERFLGLDIKGTPSVIEVFKYLEGRDVRVRRETMLQLQIGLFVKGVT